MDILIGLKCTNGGGKKNYSRCTKFVYYIRSAVLYFADLEKNLIEYFEDSEGKYDLKKCPENMKKIDWLNRKSHFQKLLIKKVKVIQEQKECLLVCINTYNNTVQNKKNCYESFLPLINLLESIKEKWIIDKENNKKEEGPYAIQLWEAHYSNVFVHSFHRQKKIEKRIGDIKKIEEVPSGFWQWNYWEKKQQSI